MVELEEIDAAEQRIAGVLPPTPLLDLADGTGIKLELLQPTGSFKVRGFLNRALAYPPAERAAGLLTVSAGNAAAACAWVAHRLGVPCRVVMLDTAPAAKVDNVRRWGGTPVLLPRAELLAWMAERRWEAEPEAFIHPFADPLVMAGAGTAGLEILRQRPRLRRVLIPTGGGGLAGGIGSALRQLRPEVEVIGVQSDGYALWPAALAAGGDPHLTPATIADGTSAPFHPDNFAVLKEVVDRWVIVPEGELRPAIARLAATGRVVAEGAGVLAYAALPQVGGGADVVAVVSGGNLAPGLVAEALAGRAGDPR